MSNETYKIGQKVWYTESTMKTEHTCQTIARILTGECQEPLYQTKERPCDGWYKHSELIPYFKIPELGLKPKDILDKQQGSVVISKEKMMERFYEIKNCIMRRMGNNDELSVEWLHEYNQILRYMEE